MNTDRGQANVELVFADRALRISEFCIKHGGNAFKGWPGGTLFAYVFFHVVARTCFVVRKGAELELVAFAWAASEDWIRERAAEKRSPFDWRTSAGEALFVGEVIKKGPRTTGPQDHGTTDHGLERLVKLLRARWTDFDERKVFTYRHGKQVELTHDVISKLLRAGH